MENSRSKESNLTKKLKQEEEPSTSLGATSSKGRKRDSSSIKKEEDKTPTPKKKIPIPPLPSELPPVNLLHRDTLRAWCQKLKLSSKGPKLEAYKRICQKAYPEQHNIPCTAKEARIKSIRQRTQNMDQEQIFQKKSQLDGTLSSEIPIPEDQLAIIQNPPDFYEEVSTTVVTSSAPESTLASWSRIASSAIGHVEEVETEAPKAAPGDKWCVVHGRSLPGNTDGWVQLQFHGGQPWVPEKKKGKVSALFLIPARIFPPRHMQDNLLCPTCVYKNKVLAKSLQ
ncbi:developmental pluripotency-associated protein 4 [Dipodomys merriami]|uniref:developmental pluripotency-associated protein 4 n=1 Tax=Dipodomys merriami TaxID=94247 RepID=UPI0038560F3E